MTVTQWPKLFRRPERVSGRSREEGLALVVVVYDMPQQAERTIYSLTSRYQQGVTEDDYEVIIVENRSDRTLSADFVEGLPDNFSYHLRHETQPTPVHAANFGVRMSRRSHTAVLIDGARMVTPGVVKNLLRGHRMHRDSVVSVPGYHLGRQLQQRAVEHGERLFAVAELEPLRGEPGVAPPRGGASKHGRVGAVLALDPQRRQLGQASELFGPPLAAPRRSDSLDEIGRRVARDELGRPKDANEEVEVGGESPDVAA